MPHTLAHTYTHAVHTLETNDKSQPQTTYVSSASVVTWIWIRDNLNLNLDRAVDGRMDVVPWMPFDDACRLATLAAKPTPESTPR